MARIREFDPDQALESAIGVFWDKGFFDTSMDDLVHGTGVARYGLYGRWGNKRELFIAALKRYGDIGTTEGPAAILGQPDASLPQIHECFGSWLDMACDERLGCMACNTAIEIAPHDEEIAAEVRKIFARLTGRFSHALSNARRKGEIQPQHGIDELAGYLSGIVRNLAVMTRAGCSRDEMKSFVTIALSTLGA